jgi:hypothetical protein
VNSIGSTDPLTGATFFTLAVFITGQSILPQLHEDLNNQTDVPWQDGRSIESMAPMARIVSLKKNHSV